MVSVPATGYRWRGRGQSAMPAVSGRALGNQLPGYTGAPNIPFRPGPSVQGTVDGQLGGTGDGSSGADPRAPKMSPWPVKFLGGQGRAQMDVPTSGARQSWWRGGIQGFNDKLTTRDRHAYWDTGHQRTGVTFDPASAPPNTYNNPRQQPPAPELRTVNRTVSYQKGSDATRNQDDLSRPYTWLGEQGAPWTPVNGGVPGLYQPYGTRGGIPYPIVSPVGQGQPGDGPHLVSGGPPHGLHTQTPWKGGAQLIRRYETTPQMRPVRVDRPSNSPQAGQSYSQTVLPQGASRVRPSRTPPGRGGHGPAQHVGRGWGGRSG